MQIPEKISIILDKELITLFFKNAFAENKLFVRCEYEGEFLTERPAGQIRFTPRQLDKALQPEFDHGRLINFSLNTDGDKAKLTVEMKLLVEM